MKNIVKNQNYLFFFLYFASALLSPGLKNVLKFSNYIDEVAVIFISIIFLINKENYFKIFHYIKNNFYLTILSLYVIFCLIFWNNFDFDNLLRVKYYLLHIIFLSIFFSIYNYKKNSQSYETIILFIFCILLIFGFLNFIFQDDYLNFFYKNLDSLDISYHNKNARLISLSGNPINFGFICNIFLIYIIYNSKLNVYLKYLLSLITVIILFFTFSRLGYIALFVTFLIYCLNKNKIKLIFSLFILVIIFLFFSKEIINFFLKYEVNHFMILFLKRIDDLLNFRYIGNYIDQLSSFNYFFDGKISILLLGNGFNSLGWSDNRFLLEFSFLSIIYEIGYGGLILYLLIILDYCKNLLKNFNIFDINIFFIIFIYGILNTGLIYNPFSLIFLYHYQKIKFSNV